MAAKMHIYFLAGTYDRINVLVESEVAYWSKELGVPRGRLVRAIEEVGEKMVDVRKRLALE